MTKKILAGIGLLTLLALACPRSTAEGSRFILGGEIRERGLYSHGYKALLAPDEKGTFWVGQRVRLNFTYEQTDLGSLDGLGLFVQLEDTRLWGQTDGSPSYGFALSEAYFHMGFGKGFGMKVGRMALHYEDGRYISHSNWDESGKTYDVLMFTFRSADHCTQVDVAGSFSNSSKSTVLNPYQVNHYFKYLAFAYASHRFNDDFRWSLLSSTHLNEAYVLREDGSFETDLGGNYVVNPSRLKAITALGTYLDICSDRKVSLILSAYGQWGKMRDNTTQNAYIASATLRCRIIPQLTLEASYDFISGNDNVRLADGEVTQNRAFDKFLGSSHSVLGIMDYFGGRHDPTQGAGMHQPYLKLTGEPHPDHSLELCGRYFWAANNAFYAYTDDGFYQLSHMNRDLGLELSLIYKFQIHRDVHLRAGYAFHTATPTLENLSGIETGKSKFSQFAFLTLQYKPTFFDSDKRRKSKEPS